MRRNSEINGVHTARLRDKYEHVKAYLCKGKRDGRRSYKDYIGSVYKLTDKDRSVTFQSECLVPTDDRGWPRVLLVFSNPHPGSIQKGMFHSPDRRISNLWTDLCEADLFSGEDHVLQSPGSLRKHCLNVVYEGDFAFGFACYWVFPTSYPSQLKSLFGPSMEPPGLESYWFCYAEGDTQNLLGLRARAGSTPAPGTTLQWLYASLSYPQSVSMTLLHDPHRYRPCPL